MAREKRIKNWWEPVFDKNTPTFSDGDWDLASKNRSPTQARFIKKSPSEHSHRSNRVTFSECDFEGDFSSGKYTFDECTFSKCDFGGSIWENARFRQCDFSYTSFSLSTFKNCEFRDCSFTKTYYSGNATVIPNTLITNPLNFISSADIFPDQIPDNVSIRYQKAHLLITQSTLSRILMDNLSREGSEESYYEAVKCRTLTAAKARHAYSVIKLYGKRRKIEFSDMKIFDAAGFIKIAFMKAGSLLEEAILRLLGGMNAWGASISRSISVGALIIIFMLMLHHILNPDTLLKNFLKVCEVFFLFGYTNYTSRLEMPAFERSLFLFNAISGLVWYAVFITTVINKLTRQRS